jgi:hypothetical protein
MSAGAEFANIAVADLGAGWPATANLYHASSLIEDVAQRYMVIPLDESTPLGTVLKSGGEVWLRSLSDIGMRYPSLLEDTIAAGLASTASVALYGRGRRVIGEMGVAWAQAQAFTDAQKGQVRVVARLAADALGRAQMLEAERAARERTERLQRTMTALVASASLAEVTAAVFQHGLPFRRVGGPAGAGRSAAARPAGDPERGRLPGVRWRRMGGAADLGALPVAGGGRHVYHHLPANPRGPGCRIPGCLQGAHPLGLPGLGSSAAAQRRAHAGHLDTRLPQAAPN